MGDARGVVHQVGLGATYRNFPGTGRFRSLCGPVGHRPLSKSDVRAVYIGKESCDIKCTQSERTCDHLCLQNAASTHIGTFPERGGFGHRTGRSVTAHCPKVMSELCILVKSPVISSALKANGCADTCASKTPLPPIYNEVPHNTTCGTILTTSPTPFI